jgi:hypothetical protein
MQALTNQPYPNRLVITCAPFQGPFVQDGPLGEFDPRRDMTVWVDGQRIAVQTFAYDLANNRYVLYMASPFNLRGNIQVTHHMPDPPFSFQSNPPILNVQVGVEPDIDAGS